ncbi:GntR family transcriptional regulator [Lacticaseibacillus parahuelsenbergensis]|uniref:GntR family transcriptional regulator n=1 Tax=Lacticaseibacillus parahuelsenbergensis TaxID=3068305 RepID=A0ABY9L3R1_9LACO|nr:MULTISPECIES: GntR family transcriptional regulator [Lacticaseibacillus]MDE3281463.1 GntR family transcriptional regulator [Lacticaseibacillus casei]WLV78381.1 GntR family transcriptional regulator [Lacticaseibacillus sp. NCIMB 15471]
MTTPVTKYELIMNSIRAKILSGVYPLDSKLPSEVKLQEEYGASRVTVRQAVDGLVRDGLVERVQGKGSYVRKPQRVSRLVRESTVESFSKVAKQSGFVPHTKVLKVERVQTTEKLSRLLTTTSKNVLHTVRLRYLDDDPIFIESNYYPLPRFASLPDYDLNGSLYAIFKDHFGIRAMSSDNTTLSIKTADVEAADLLNRSVGFPLFYLETQIFDDHDQVVQYGEQLIASDRYQFKI